MRSWPLNQTAFNLSNACFGAPGNGGDAFLFDTMYSSISFGKSTPPRNRQLNIINQYVDDCVEELTF